jgi:hypothetical protein
MHGDVEIVSGFPVSQFNLEHWNEKGVSMKGFVDDDPMAESQHVTISSWTKNHTFVNSSIF